MTLWKVYLAILLVTATEGGMNTIYPPFLGQLRFLDLGSFAGPLLAGYVASLTDLPTMFRVAPLAMLALYVALTV